MTTNTPLWERFDSTHVVGRHVRCYAEVTSTMDVARSLALAGAAEGEAVLALRQTRGRGRFGRPWLAEPGDALLLSVTMRPPTVLAGRLGVVGALAVVRAVRSLAGLDATLKWPNDVLVYDRKLAGILVESSVDTSGAVTAVLGIGLNLNLDPTTDGALERVATSIRDITGKPAGLEAWLDAVLLKLDDTYRQALDGADVVAEWRALLDTLGKRVRVRQRDRLIVGLAEDVDADGHLVLRTDDGNRHVVSEGDVTLAGR